MRSVYTKYRNSAAAKAIVVLVGGLHTCISFSHAAEMEFLLDASSVAEESSIAKVWISVSEPLDSAVRIDVSVTSLSATPLDQCSSRDYIAPQNFVVLDPGETQASIELAIVDDGIAEIDETLQVALLASEDFELGANTIHQLTILDDDRDEIVDVRDFGAAADGISDDRESIQAAIEAAREGYSVVYFPPGDYLVSDAVEVYTGMTLSGFEARLLRMPFQGNWEHTLLQRPSEWKVNSNPLLIQGFEIDGNSSEQGEFRSYELQQSHLIYLLGGSVGHADSPRVRVFIEDVVLVNGTGDGVSIVRNIEAHLCNVLAKDVFRGGLTVTGGNSRVHVYGLTTWGETDPTGIDVEIEDDAPVEISFENIRLLNGDFDVSMSRSGLAEGSTLIASDVRSYGSSFFLNTLKAKVRISDSEFWVGAYEPPLGNTILQSQDVEFSEVVFVLTEDFRAASRIEPLVESDRVLSALNVIWDTQFTDAIGDKQIVCRNCVFRIDDETIEPEDTAYVMQARGVDRGESNVLTLVDPVVDRLFDSLFAPICDECVVDGQLER